jgi:hypothetical protein
MKVVGEKRCAALGHQVYESGVVTNQLEGTYLVDIINIEQ